LQQPVLPYVATHGTSRKSSSYNGRSAAQATRMNLVVRGISYNMYWRNITSLTIWVHVSKKRPLRHQFVLSVQAFTSRV